MARLDARDILERMYESGAGSDLDIGTNAHIFNVHKSVLSAAGPYFEAAGHGQWRESQTRVIQLPEEEVVVDAILRHCYGLNEEDEHECKHHRPGDCLLSSLQIAVAARKYRLPDLEEGAREYFLSSVSLQYEEHEENIRIGTWLYQEDRREILGPTVVKSVVKWIAYDMALILGDFENWQKLQAMPELLTDAMRLVASGSRECSKNAGSFEEPQYLREPGVEAQPKAEAEDDEDSEDDD